jgi:hypothetical protein
LPTGRAAALLRLERDSEYRSQLLDDLQELRGFLALRKGALAGSGARHWRAVLPAVVLAAWLRGIACYSSLCSWR